MTPLQKFNFCWEVAEHLNLNANELIVLLAIVEHAREKDFCWPSLSRLSRRSRLGERTVQRTLQRLEEVGLILVEPGGGRSSNKYKLVFNIPGHGDTHGVPLGHPSPVTLTPQGCQPDTPGVSQWPANHPIEPHKKTTTTNSGCGVDSIPDDGDSPVELPATRDGLDLMDLDRALAQKLGADGAGRVRPAIVAALSSLADPEAQLAVDELTFGVRNGVVTNPVAWTKAVVTRGVETTSGGAAIARARQQRNMLEASRLANAAAAADRLASVAGPPKLTVVKPVDDGLPTSPSSAITEFLAQANATLGRRRP